MPGSRPVFNQLGFKICMGIPSLPDPKWTISLPVGFLFFPLLHYAGNLGINILIEIRLGR